MGQVLRGSASTTAAIRRAIQNSQESLRALAKRHAINSKTVAKWRSRSSTSDIRPGPKDAHSTVLNIEEEAMIVAFRKHTLLPLDDCLYALQASIPHLTRSSLHRCLQRHAISRLPEVEGDKALLSEVEGGIQFTTPGGGGSTVPLESFRPRLTQRSVARQSLYAGIAPSSRLTLSQNRLRRGGSI